MTSLPSFGEITNQVATALETRGLLRSAHGSKKGFWVEIRGNKVAFFEQSQEELFATLWRAVELGLLAADVCEKEIATFRKHESVPCVAVGRIGGVTHWSFERFRPAGEAASQAKTKTVAS